MFKAFFNPAVIGQNFKRLEARLVGHLLAILDPVTKIDERQSFVGRGTNAFEYDECAKAAPGFFRFKAAIDQ